MKHTQAPWSTKTKWRNDMMQGWEDAKIFKKGKRFSFLTQEWSFFPRKLQTGWDKPFIVKQLIPHEAIELTERDGTPFKVNGHRVKHYEEWMSIEETKGETVKFAVTALT